jgi:DNA-binding CsgD family transcriptional regulator
VVATWVRPPLPTGWLGGTQPTFVGRGRELATLDAAWSAVVDGARQLVFVGGEPGAGKSRLLAEVSAVLYEHDAAVLCGTCFAELGLPYQPFVRPISALLPAIDDGDVPTDDSRQISQRLMALAGRHAVGRNPGPEREYQRDLYEAAAEAFRTVAAKYPLILAMEDLHWAGENALQLLTYLVEHTADARILILATHRTTAPERDGPLAKTMTELHGQAGVRRLDLSPLDVDAITDYLVHEAGVSARRARASAAILRDQTGGNPFFLRELWRDLSTRGGLSAIRSEGVLAPESVRDTLRFRLERLATTNRRVLEFAAVIGESFEVAILLAVVDDPPEKTLTALDEAVELGLIEHAPNGDEPFRFPHALARQAVLDLIPPSHRILSHARVAEVVEGQFPAVDHRVQRLAHHYACAQALGLASKAVHYLIEAAVEADRTFAHGDAATLFSRAATLSGDSQAGDDLWLAAARSHFLSADFVNARDIDERVATTGRPGQRVRAAIGYENACFRLGRAANRAVELLADALRSMDRNPADPTYVRALAGLGRALSYVGAVDEARGVTTRAVEYARTIGDEKLVAAALQASLWHPEPPLRARAKLDRAIELTEVANRTGSMAHLGPASTYRAITSYVLGEPDELSAAHADLLRTVGATGEGHFRYLADCVSYARHFIAGDFAGAERTCAALLDLGESFGTEDTEGSYGLQMYMIRRETGALERIRPLITGNEQPTEQWPPALLALYTELELVDPTARLLRWLMDNDLPSYHHSAQWPGMLAFMVEAALFLRDEATARRLRPLVADYAGFNLVAGELNALFGSADRYLGSIDSLLGTGTPEDWLDTALEMDTLMDAPVHQAHTLAARVVHARRRRVSGPRLDELVERARSLADELGLTRVRRMIETPSGYASGLARPNGLTVREAEVLSLLGEGLSNRDIADRLVISENTAANHVRSILLKTGSANRTQAAVYAAARGLLA